MLGAGAVERVHAAAHDAAGQLQFFIGKFSVLIIDLLGRRTVFATAERASVRASGCANASAHAAGASD
jgi:hypothetical protein